MKSKFHFILLLGFSFSIFSCKSSKQSIDTSKIEAIVEVSKMNVVYRGVSNPLKISIPDARVVEAYAPGLHKNKKDSGYTMNPGTGKKVKIEIKGVLKNGDTIHKTKVLRINDIGKPIGKIDGYGCGAKCIVELSKDELHNGMLSVELKGFTFDLDFNITSFKIKFPKKATIYLIGNKLNEETRAPIDSLKVGDMVYIFDIRIKIKGATSYKMKKVSPIKIKIVE